MILAVVSSNAAAKWVEVPPLMKKLFTPSQPLFVRRATW
jgi:hypothetical protein